MRKTGELKVQDGSSDRGKPQRRYMAGLDGLRALAVLAVIFYHLRQYWLPGGFLGVAVFFTLSGYLITDILANGRSGEARSVPLLHMKDFWIRRARRLLPGMLTVMSAVVLWGWLADSSIASALKGDVPAALLYISNWWFIFHEVSYFDSFGPPSPLTHLWSLAVEEQFYMVWPLVLAIGFKFIRTRALLAGWVLGLAAVSALWMAVLYNPGTDPSRVYYGTDTRGFALLVGAALALVWPGGKLKRQVSRQAAALLDAAGLISLALLGYWTYSANQYDSVLYRGGLFGIALVTSILIAVLAHPGSRLGVWLSFRPLAWIGKRAYGLYLWHYPVISLTTPQLDNGEDHGLRILLQLLAAFLLASASYRFIEDPIRKYGLRGWFEGISSVLSGFGKWKRLPAVSLGLAAAAILLGFIHLYAPFSAPSHTEAVKEGTATTVMPVFQQHAGGQSSGQQGNAPGAEGHSAAGSQSGKPGGQSPGNSGAGQIPQPSAFVPEGSSEPSPSDSSTSLAPPSPAPDEQGSPPSVPSSSAIPSAPSPTQSTSKPGDAAHGDSGKPAGTGEGITAVGDSVMLDIEGDLHDLYPDAVIDGKVGRQMGDAPDVLQQLGEEGKLNGTVILELGTNGAFSKKQMQKVLGLLKDAQRIFLVNTRVPRPWESSVNKALAKTAAEDTRIQLVDWYKESEGQSSYFEKDGVHLKPEGAAAYTALLIQALSRK